MNSFFPFQKINPCLVLSHLVTSLQSHPSRCIFYTGFQENTNNAVSPLVSQSFQLLRKIMNLNLSKVALKKSSVVARKWSGHVFPAFSCFVQQYNRRSALALIFFSSRLFAALRFPASDTARLLILIIDRGIIKVALARGRFQLRISVPLGTIGFVRRKERKGTRDR